VLTVSLAASMAAMSIFLIVIIASKARLGLTATGRKRIRQRTRGDLRGEAPAVLAPAALAFRATIADDPRRSFALLILASLPIAHRVRRLLS
jgi:hypothetical protein